MDSLADQQPCASDKEDQIDLRLQPTSKVRAAAATGQPKVTVSVGGQTLSLAEAELTGAVSVYGDPKDGRVTIVAAHGSKVTTSGRDITAAVSSISGTAKSPTKRFGPVDGPVTVTAGPTATATRAGKKLKTSHRDRSAPKVRARLQRKGRSATLTLKASDGSGVRAIAVRYAKVVRIEHGALVVVRFAKLPRAGRLVRWQATDAFGNASRVRSIRIKPVKRP